MRSYFFNKEFEKNSLKMQLIVSVLRNVTEDDDTYQEETFLSRRNGIMQAACSASQGLFLTDVYKLHPPQPPSPVVIVFDSSSLI